MTDENAELLLLHALPLDGSMWSAQMELLPEATYAPTLYGFGDRIEKWAVEALKLTKGNRVIAVGCSIGGSCALEVAALAPDRVAALVLIGTKATRRLVPAFHVSALKMLREMGVEAGWAPFHHPPGYLLMKPGGLSSLGKRAAVERASTGAPLVTPPPPADCPPGGGSHTPPRCANLHGPSQGGALSERCCCARSPLQITSTRFEIGHPATLRLHR